MGWIHGSILSRPSELLMRDLMQSILTYLSLEMNWPFSFTDLILFICFPSLIPWPQYSVESLLHSDFPARQTFPLCIMQVMGLRQMIFFFWGNEILKQLSLFWAQQGPFIKFSCGNPFPGPHCYWKCHQSINKYFSGQQLENSMRSWMWQVRRQWGTV